MGNQAIQYILQFFFFFLSEQFPVDPSIKTVHIRIVRIMKISPKTTSTSCCLARRRTLQSLTKQERKQRVRNRMALSQTLEEDDPAGTERG